MDATMMLGDYKLLSCPFCGNKDLDYLIFEPQENEVFTYFTRRYSIQCSYTGSQHGCGASSGHYKTLYEAVEVWNKRVIENELMKKCPALFTGVDQMIEAENKLHESYLKVVKKICEIIRRSPNESKY